MGFDRRYVPGLAVLLAGTVNEAGAIGKLFADLTVRSEDREVVDAGANAAAAKEWLNERWALVAAEIAKRKPGGVPRLAPKLQPVQPPQQAQQQQQQVPQQQAQAQAQPQLQLQWQPQPQPQWQPLQQPAHLPPGESEQRAIDELKKMIAADPDLADSLYAQIERLEQQKQRALEVAALEAGEAKLQEEIADLRRKMQGLISLDLRAAIELVEKKLAGVRDEIRAKRSHASHHAHAAGPLGAGARAAASGALTAEEEAQLAVLHLDAPAGFEPCMRTQKFTAGAEALAADSAVAFFVAHGEISRREPHALTQRARSPQRARACFPLQRRAPHGRNAAERRAHSGLPSGLRAGVALGHLQPGQGQRLRRNDRVGAHANRPAAAAQRGREGAAEDAGRGRQGQEGRGRRGAASGRGHLDRPASLKLFEPAR